ncbi:hypothetical protein K456DRAFT_1492064 [Colletotrichum gloeosporioides 23]|nr:hypothetical protein K456DRAFT_1492064 [Colletotrichum gloeosporioides 23]
MMPRLWLLIGPLTRRVNLTAYSHKARRRWPQDGLWSRTSCLSSNPAPSLPFWENQAADMCMCVVCRAYSTIAIYDCLTRPAATQGKHDCGNARCKSTTPFPSRRFLDHSSRCYRRSPSRRFPRSIPLLIPHGEVGTSSNKVIVTLNGVPRAYALFPALTPSSAVPCPPPLLLPVPARP